MLFSWYSSVRFSTGSSGYSFKPICPSQYGAQPPHYTTHQKHSLLPHPFCFAYTPSWIPHRLRIWASVTVHACKQMKQERQRPATREASVTRGREDVRSRWVWTDNMTWLYFGGGIHLWMWMGKARPVLPFSVSVSEAGMNHVPTSGKVGKERIELERAGGGSKWIREYMHHLKL